MYKNILKISLVAAGLFLLNGCQSAPTLTGPGHTLDVTTVLNQINEAIQESIDPNNKDFPPLTSVNLDLQVEVTTVLNASAKFPMVLTAASKNSNSRFHQITLTFTP